jgi:hypothetical protein
LAAKSLSKSRNLEEKVIDVITWATILSASGSGKGSWKPFRHTQNLFPAKKTPHRLER